MNPLMAFWSSPAWLHRVAVGLVVLGIAALVSAALLWVAQRETFSLKWVEVHASETGLRHVQDADIREALERGLAGSVLATPLAPIRDALDDHPWVREVSLRRVWPNRFLFQIQEHEPVAAWRDGRLLNRQGELFTADRAWAQTEAEVLYGCRLVELSGPVGSQARVLTRAAQTQRILESYGFSLKALTLSDQFAWQVSLSDGLEVALGQDELPTPWDQRLGALSQVMQRIAVEPSNQSSFVRVDLRYANGFAFLSTPLSATVPAQAGPTPPNCLHRLAQGNQNAA
jgi:cell division protein FtsQ